MTNRVIRHLVYEKCRRCDSNSDPFCIGSVVQGLFPHIVASSIQKDKSLQECREDTQNITKYLREDVCVNVVEIWECEWESKKRENPCIQAFLDDNTIGFRSALRGSVNQMSILEKVKDGSLFGLVQCDLHVPEHLRDYFSEMPPIFKNTTISRDEILYCK